MLAGPGKTSRGPAPPADRPAHCLPYRVVARPKVTLRAEPPHGRHPLPPLLPGARPAPAAPLRCLARLLHRRPVPPTRRRAVRLHLPHRPLLGPRLPRRLPRRPGSPLFAEPRRGRPARTGNPGAPAQPHEPATADARQLGLTPGRRLRSRVAGVFLVLPLLARLGFDTLVRQAGYPGSRMIPAAAALLSLLALKLLDKERRSHISDFNFDEALGLFAGLNVPPKKSYATDYSYRTMRTHQEQLLSGWVAGLAPLLFPEAEAFCLDFHPIPYRGEPEALENHYLPLRGKAGPSVLTFFAHEPQSRVLCYANANLTRADQPGELMRFVEFWQGVTGHDPQWLYFDSKLAPYPELARVNERHIWFVTIRRRGAAILRRLRARPATDWRRAVLDIPKRRHKNIRYVEETVRVRDYPGPLRQLAVSGLGREEPTLCLSNNFAA